MRFSQLQQLFMKSNLIFQNLKQTKSKHIHHLDSIEDISIVKHLKYEGEERDQEVALSFQIAKHGPICSRKVVRKVTMPSLQLLQ